MTVVFENLLRETVYIIDFIIIDFIIIDFTEYSSVHCFDKSMPVHVSMFAGHCRLSAS